MNSAARFRVAGAVMLACVPAAQAVDIQTVTVGNPGNARDTRYETPGYGGVDYVYWIGKFEVTAGQYTEFLNAVAKTDTYGLYNTSMWSGIYGCKIERTGSSPDYGYSVAGDWANRPVNYVSWGDTARFCNWLHNGQPAGAQDLNTTEDGSYYLNGATSAAALMAIVRQPDATWVIPSEDEWYKAAYHKNDGVTGNYFDYPTSTDSVPGYVNDSGNLSGTGTAFTEGGMDPGNYATYDGDGGTPGIGSPYNRTVFGEWENSASPYDTFDQGGNLWEWNEAKLYGSARGLRGGSFEYDHIRGLQAAYRDLALDPPYEDAYFGFRIAMVGDCNNNGVPDHEDIAQGTSSDENGNGIPDECECAVIAEPPQAEPTVVAKGRYLAFVPGNAGEQTALRVRLADLPPPFEAMEGATLWVGTPQDISEAPGSSGATPPTFKGASLGCEPVYMDWGSIDLLRVYGAAIVPSGAYQVQALNQACSSEVESHYSSPLTVFTSLWGDLVGNCSVTPCTPPNEIVNFDDIAAVVDKFKNLPGAPAKSRTDVAPDTPDRIINFTDIPAVIDAFKGLPYPYPGPQPCP